MCQTKKGAEEETLWSFPTAACWLFSGSNHDDLATLQKTRMSRAEKMVIFSTHFPAKRTFFVSLPRRVWRRQLNRKSSHQKSHRDQLFQKLCFFLSETHFPVMKRNISNRSKYRKTVSWRFVEKKFLDFNPSEFQFLVMKRNKNRQKNPENTSHYGSIFSHAPLQLLKRVPLKKRDNL